MNNNDTKNCDVIIIDDDESIREGCRQTLEEEGFCVVVAVNGLQGLRLVEKLRPKVAITDLKMPGISGLEVLERITEIDPDIVVMATSGYGVIDSKKASIKSGAFEFLAKPFEPEQLINTVNRAIEKSNNK